MIGSMPIHGDQFCNVEVWPRDVYGEQCQRLYQSLARLNLSEVDAYKTFSINDINCVWQENHGRNPC